MPRTFSLQSGDNCRLRSLAEEPVEFGPTRIDHPAEAIEDRVFLDALATLIPRQNRQHLNAVLLGEIIVALIVAGNRHDSASAITRNDEVTSVDRHFFAIQRIDCKAPEWNAFLLLQHIDSLEFRQLRALVSQFAPTSLELSASDQILAKRMLW